MGNIKIRNTKLFLMKLYWTNSALPIQDTNGKTRFAMDFLVLSRLLSATLMNSRRKTTAIWKEEPRGTTAHNNLLLSTMSKVYLWEMLLKRKYYLLCRCLSASKLDSSYNEDTKISKEFQDLTLDELEVVATLGMGGFGRVELVRDDILIFSGGWGSERTLGQGWEIIQQVK